MAISVVSNWYKTCVPIAEELYSEHLKELDKEED